MRKTIIIKILFVLILCLLECSAYAKNCGVIGTVYPIAEVDLRTIIQQRLIVLQQTGELTKLQTQFNQALQQTMDRPQPVIDLKRTLAPNTRLFDPSLRFPYDIKNNKGEVVIPKNTLINPLDTISLNETLLFYNADDRDQVSWAKRMDQALKGKDKLILVNGSVISQMKLFRKPVYFDQGGRLTTRFQLHQVPAFISQQGKYLRIQEVQP